MFTSVVLANIVDATVTFLAFAHLLRSTWVDLIYALKRNAKESVNSSFTDSINGMWKPLAKRVQLNVIHSWVLKRQTSCMSLAKP